MTAGDTTVSGDGTVATDEAETSGDGTVTADEAETSGDGTVAADEAPAAEEMSVEKRIAAAKAAIGKIGQTIREAAAEKPEVIIVY